MAKPTITRAQLEEWVTQFDEDGGCDATDRQLEALIRQSLAAMDSKPVGEFYEDGPLNWYQISDGDRVPSHRRIPLYRHAQPVPVVPNEIKHRIGGLDWGWEGEFNRGWNACRAAMLQELKNSAGTEAICRSDENVQVLHTKSLAQSDCCPAQNQGWIPVSEQMPEVGDIVLTAMGGVVNVGETECSAANCRFFTSAISGRELPATHWMPLPDAPQEPKP